MKIIQRGVIPEEREYQVACPKCKTIFEFKHAEATYNSDQRDGDYLSICCPLCFHSCTKDARDYIRRGEKQYAAY